MTIDSKMTPMMKQYFEIKKNHQSEILFFRMGDFYEMFFEDAVIASKILDIALTSRQNDVPMCGIPYHAAESYLVRLIKAGRRVAICEQLETVPTTGTIVRREVVRIITPGTVVESNMLQGDDNNFLASIIITADEIGLAFVDISTGDFFIISGRKSIDIFRGEISRFNPGEAVLHTDSPDEDIFIEYIKMKNIPIYRINDWLFDRNYMEKVILGAYGLNNLKGIGLTSDIEIVTAGAALQYLIETQKKTLSHIKYPKRISTTDRMILDDAAISSLEITSNQQDGSRNRTIFSILNKTKTPMGRRALERNLLEPLLNQNAIEKRLELVQYFFEFHSFTQQVQERLNGIYDLERLISRFTINKPMPRNFIALKNSINESMKIKQLLLDQPVDNINSIAEKIPDIISLSEYIERAVDDDPAISPENGRVIRAGFNPDLDRLYELKENANAWILKYQETEKIRLNIPTLKVKYNKIIGYYIEITKAQSAGIPADYYRKQTLLGAERYTTDKLREFETDVLSSSEKIISLEKKEIENIRIEILKNREALQLAATVIAETDFLCSLASTAIENKFIRPVFTNDGSTRITDGRHPVVEKYYTKEIFIPNDIYFDSEKSLIKIITGPNMSGKSTYIRMAAVIQLMAQVGSFVPASSAEISIVDRIFTRIGASDNISRGESTFLVEMNETAGILNGATDKSLIIMDEIGRGTSTYDGLSIAWSIVEYILRYLKAKTMFATHYHELTQLGDKQGIENYNVVVKENIGSVEFLHKVSKGSADKSYGIHVAKLAGIPKQVTSRAEKILEKLEKGRKNADTPSEDDNTKADEQLEIFNASNHLVIQAIKNIDIEKITPVDALNELYRLKKIAE